MRSHSATSLHRILFFIALLLTSGLAFAATGDAIKMKKSATEIGIGKECVSCHLDDNPGLVAEWKKSEHSKKKCRLL